MRPRKGRVNHERWLVSYADFITLLFGFFVVLYAFAKADQQKQQQISVAIDEAFRSMGFMPIELPNPKDLPAVAVTEQHLAPVEVKQDLERIQHELKGSLAGEVAGGVVSIQMGREGLVISLREAGFFDSGSATPKPAALPTLRKIASLLARSPYDLRVEGHTDNVPIHNAVFASNWELSTARATGIARLFLDMKAVSPERLSAAGYAEFHPVAGNDTPEGRARNRRVDLIVMPRTSVNFATQSGSRPSGAWRRITDGDR